MDSQDDESYIEDDENSEFSRENIEHVSGLNRTMIEALQEDNIRLQRNVDRLKVEIVQFMDGVQQESLRMKNEMIHSMGALHQENVRLREEVYDYKRKLELMENVSSNFVRKDEPYSSLPASTASAYASAELKSYNSNQFGEKLGHLRRNANEKGETMTSKMSSKKTTELAVDLQDDLNLKREMILLKKEFHRSISSLQQENNKLKEKLLSFEEKKMNSSIAAFQKENTELKKEIRWFEKKLETLEEFVFKLASSVT